MLKMIFVILQKNINFACHEIAEIICMKRISEILLTANYSNSKFDHKNMYVSSSNTRFIFCNARVIIFVNHGANAFVEM